MDPTRFASVTYPNYMLLDSAAVKYTAPEEMMPTTDVRYPGLAATMSDSRIMTDYKPKCAANIPVQAQRGTKIWMQNNADEIMNISRGRMAERIGVTSIYDVPTMPEEMADTCGPYNCSKQRVVPEGAWAIGVGRPNGVPDLFGTFQATPTMAQTVAGKNTKLTTVYEGGRNTPSRLRVQN
jgi:hypothetical protein